MNARTLLNHLRDIGITLEVTGDKLHIDAPAEAITEELCAALVEYKANLLNLLTRERRNLEKANKHGLVIRWSRNPGWITLHDPTTGEWHEIKASECLPRVVETANAHLRFSEASAGKRGKREEVTQQGISG